MCPRYRHDMSKSWRKTALANVIDIIDGGTPRTTISEYWHGSIPWLSVSDFNLGYRWVNSAAKSITQLGVSESATTVLDKGDVIISARGTVGVVAQLGRPMAFNQSCYGIRGKPGIADTDFIYYLLHGIVPRLKQVAHGAVFDTITRETFRIVEVNLPPLSEQRAIARILGTLDDKIELNRRMNETLEVMARALFKSWFIDFDPVHAKAEGRDTGLPPDVAALFPDSFEDSELGQIPRGWTVRSLGELVSTVKGCSYASDDLVDSDTALVTLKSFARGGGYRSDGLKSFAGFYKPEQVVTPGDIVIACTDVTQAAAIIGRTAMVHGTAAYQTLVASLDTIIIRPNSQKTTRSFLYCLGRTDEFVSHTYSHTTGTTVLHLAKEAIPSFVFALPPLQLVMRFDSLAEPILNLIRASVEQSETIVALRDAMLPKLLSGQLRVGDAGS